MELKGKTIQRLYFVGIGGIGMSGLALYFKKQGYQVEGYDRTPSTITQNLENQGISISYRDNIQTIREAFQQNSAETLVVFTPAIPKDSSILGHFQTQGFYMIKRAELLGMLSREKFSIGVAGTHGKTTTSSLITHLLHQAGISVSAFLGGIASNFNSNLVIGESEYLVLESDEYDRSFLHLNPNISVITSTDADHLDIYHTHEQLLVAFNQYAEKTASNGKLWVKKGLNIQRKHYSYSTQEEADIYAKNIRIEDNHFVFDAIVSLPNHKLEILNIKSGLPGLHNIENALPCIGIALELGLSIDQIKAGIESFKGVKRRFEVVQVNAQKVLIDDYAHHPTEIEAFLSSVKKLYKNKKVACIFMPHLYSRTRDFAQGFSASLSIADKVYLLPIYPARELPISGVSSNMLMDDIHTEKSLCDEKSLMLMLDKEKDQFDIICTVGAGDLNLLHDKIWRTIA
jgi:UDP-N-acetylmuramate--alanine ligase